MALNCTVVPTTADCREGYKESAVSVTGGMLVPVSVVGADRPPNTALILVVPAPATLARPALVMVATPVFNELQATWFVRSCVLLSE